MKKIVLLSVALVLSNLTLIAQTEPDWTRVLQASSYNFPAAKVVAADADHVYMAGNISGPITFENTTYTAVGLSDMIVFKLSNTGNVTWVKQINAQANGTISPEAMQLDANQNLFIVGTFSGGVVFGTSTITADATNNAFIAKFDASGNVKWATAFAASGSGNSKIVFDANGNSYLNSKSKALIKFSISGDKEWEQNYPDRTLQAIAVYGPDLFIGGALQPGNTIFGTINLSSASTYNTGFMAKANLDGVYNKTLITGSAKEGNYHAVGTFVHPTAGTRVIDLTKTLTGSVENVFSTTIGDLAASSGTLILTINPENTVTISGSTSGSISLTQSGINVYDPVAKTFTLNYSYEGGGGTRIVSEVLAKEPTPISGDGTAISDFTVDNNGNLIVTGAFTQDLTLDTITIKNSTKSHYTFIAKCDNNFAFAWAKASDAISNTREMVTYRLFQDNTNNIYQYGLYPNGVTNFTYGSVSVTQKPQFLFKFNSNGEVLSGYGLLNTSGNRIIVAPDGKIVVVGSVVNDGTSQVGNFFVALYNNDLSSDRIWISSNNKAGTISINYVKHDTSGNTYTQARIQGYCNFFGTIIKSDNGTTVNAKFDKSGNVIWINQIDDLGLSVVGSKIFIDKDNNLLAIGSFSTSLTIGPFNLDNSNSLNDGYVVKYSPSGQVLWATQIATEGSNQIMGITSDKAGNVIVTGEFKNLLTVGTKTIDAGSVDGVFIIKLDTEGNCLWANGFPIGDVVYTSMLSSDENNNIYMVGEMYNSANNQLAFGTVIAPQTTDDGGTVLVKFNPDGVPQWAYTYGGVLGQGYSDGWPTDIRTDANGNSYLLGYCSSNAKFGATTLTNPIGSSYSYYLTKINTKSEVVWAEALYFKSPVYRYGDLLDMDKKGNIYVGGHFKDAIEIKGTTYNPVGTNDFFVTKFNDDGSFQWIKTMPANSAGISALSVYDEDVLTICGKAGKDQMLGSFPIDSKGSSTCIIATLGMLEPMPNTLNVSASDGSEATFSIYTNTDWTATSNQDWLTLSSASGSGNATLTFTAEANPSTEPREATVTIEILEAKVAVLTGTKEHLETNAMTQTVTIIQAGRSTNIDALNEKDYILYPNPASSTLYVSGLKQNEMVSIFDANGKILLNKQINGNQIDVSDLASGFYTIKIVNKDRIEIKKFIKR
jgi:hypothetical protein